MKTLELNGTLLDYWVGVANKKYFTKDRSVVSNMVNNKLHNALITRNAVIRRRQSIKPNGAVGETGVVVTSEVTWAPSRDYKQGMVIVEREKIATWGSNGVWYAVCPNSVLGYTGSDTYIDVCAGDGIDGPTLLVAAMRAFVQSVCGDNVTDVIIVKHSVI